MAASTPAKNEESKQRHDANRCGIIMPISAMGDYEAPHWFEVLQILKRAIKDAELEPVEVWIDQETDIIQRRIVTNIYKLPIAVCVSSGLNPNVMLELGMRLAFGKATVIVSDEITRVPFDISVIEYLSYPRNLHILKTEQFIAQLATRLIDLNNKVEQGTYQPFIKTFGPIELGDIGGGNVDLSHAILNQLEALERSVRRIEIDRVKNKVLINDHIINPAMISPSISNGIISLRFDQDRAEEAGSEISSMPYVDHIVASTDGTFAHIHVIPKEGMYNMAMSAMRALTRHFGGKIIDHRPGD